MLRALLIACLLFLGVPARAGVRVSQSYAYRLVPVVRWYYIPPVWYYDVSYEWRAYRYEVTITVR